MRNYFNAMATLNKGNIKEHLKTAAMVVFTAIVSITALVGVLLATDQYTNRLRAAPSYIQEHKCQFEKREWTGQYREDYGRSYADVYLKYRNTWNCDNGPYYQFDEVKKSPVEAGRFIAEQDAKKGK